MSRAKSRSNPEICADCGLADPSWASINKGIFLCTECCSVHRTFGKHISQIKSLHRSHWSPTQLLMVQTLNNNGINNVWEHCLLDNNSKFLKLKPQPKDPLHPTKADFIRSKHQQCLFVFRPNRDDTLCTESELSKQLHSSVRTGNLELSVRLLVQGAEPNFFHDEKGTTPLHVAAKANQALQAELLMIYGADPSSPDAHGVTPVEYAKAAGNKELADRLVECMYEVTDRLTQYVCNKKPEHQSGKHFLLPNNGSTSDPTSLSKLQKLPNHLFEELVTDVYDEIDRRETEAIWLSCSDSLELSTIPFLPVDPGLSTTRNQGRQKLARFTIKELMQLVYDILYDIRRRQLTQGKNLNASALKHVSQISDDEPLYDSVASDEDYAILSPAAQVTPDKSDTYMKSERSTSASPPIKASPAAVEVLTKRLIQSDSTISELRAEVRVLKTIVEKLNSENNDLKSRISQSNSEMNSAPDSLNSIGQSLNGSLDINIIGETNSSNNINTEFNVLNNGDNVDGVNNNNNVDLNKMRRGRPTSMYETREGIKTPNWQLLKNQIKSEERPSVTQSMYSGGDSSQLEERLTKCTEKVTHRIHDLWKCVQNSNTTEGCIPCADKIRVAVAELTTIVPPGAANDNIRLLLDSASRLQLECAGLQHAALSGDSKEHQVYSQKIRLSAYDIAKTTKDLVTKFLKNTKIPTNETASKK